MPRSAQQAEKVTDGEVKVIDIERPLQTLLLVVRAQRGGSSRNPVTKKGRTQLRKPVRFGHNRPIQCDDIGMAQRLDVTLADGAKDDVRAFAGLDLVECREESDGDFAQDWLEECFLGGETVHTAWSARRLRVARLR